MHQLTVDQAMKLAISAHEAGRLAEAQAIYLQILERQPNHARALQLLGVIAQQKGDFATAIKLMEQSIAVDPTDRNAHSNLSLALRADGQLERAVASARTAVQLDPGWPVSHNNLGVTLASLGEFTEAATAFRQALALRPDWGELLVNFGAVLNETGRFSEALSLLRKAVHLLPNSAMGWNNFGNSLRDLGQLDEAIAAYGQALRLDARYSDAHNNLGMALNHKGQFENALAACAQAVELDSRSAAAHMNFGIMRLRLGEFERGWAEYAWRKNLKGVETKAFSQPQWDGTLSTSSGQALSTSSGQALSTSSGQALSTSSGQANAGGRTILLHGEQGFGDVMQFVRYALLVAGRGAKVIVQCAPELSRLLKGLPCIEVIAEGEPLPAFDVQCPILDLPRIFNTRLDSIPAFIPYLKAPADLAVAWRSRFCAFPRQLRVGLAWAGRPTHPEDHKRSIYLSQLSSLATSNGVTFFSLQKGPAARQTATAPPGMKLVDCSEDFEDFADTAAAIHHLDLIITVDTSIAHLAGAMGKPVWVLLPFVADWRWLRDRDDSPWYPTMRLFRQQRIGDWAGVINRVAESLDEIVENSKSPARQAWKDHLSGRATNDATAADASDRGKIMLHPLPPGLLQDEHQSS